MALRTKKRPTLLVEELYSDDACKRPGTHWHPLAEWKKWQECV
jgi:hypothetical protein